MGSGAFIALPLEVLNSPAMVGLSANARRLFVDMCGLYRYGHNGDISVARSIMENRGWTSHASLQRAVEELANAGIIEQTRQGGRNRASLYGFTWQAIDHCGGKLDTPEQVAPSSLWRLPQEEKKGWPCHRATGALSKGQTVPASRPPPSTTSPSTGPVSNIPRAVVARPVGTSKTLPCRSGIARSLRNRWHRSAPRKAHKYRVVAPRGGMVFKDGASPQPASIALLNYNPSHKKPD